MEDVSLGLVVLLGVAGLAVGSFLNVVIVRMPVGESLLPALPLLVRHHVVVIAAVRDPDVVGWATTAPDGPDEAYRAAAATAALAERDRTIARLRGLGAVVVDAPAGELAPKLADSYLDLKATGTL